MPTTTLPPTLNAPVAHYPTGPIVIPAGFVRDYPPFVGVLAKGDLGSIEAARRVIVGDHHDTLSGWCRLLPVDWAVPVAGQAEVAAIFATFATAECYRFAAARRRTARARAAAMDLAHDALGKLLRRLFCSDTEFVRMTDYACFQKYCCTIVRNAEIDDAARTADEPQPVEAAEYMTAARAMYRPHKRYSRRPDPD